MKTIQKITFILLLILPLVTRAEVKEIPFTIDDRDPISGPNKK